MRISFWLMWLGLVALLATPQTSAQEQAHDESTLRGPGMRASSDLRKAKHERAKDGGWAWTFLGTAAAGVDSNIFQSPTSETDSAFYDFGLKAEALHYFDSRERLTLSLATTGSLYAEDSNASELVQEVEASYVNRLTKHLYFSVEGTMRHENNNMADILGNELIRDFGHFVYELEPSLRLRLGKRQSVSISYAVKRKDYTDSSGQDALDWWSHGPAIRYRAKIGKSLSLRARYGFSVRTYDEDPASLSDGTELLVNPAEEHYYHQGLVQGKWRPHPWFAFSAGYRMRIKDDRFQDFESYEDRKWEVELTFSPFRSVLVRAAGSYAERDYDRRLGELPGETLEWERLTGSVTAHYQLTPNLAIFATYASVNRDTNRDDGTAYRDYKTHTLLSGVTFAR